MDKLELFVTFSIQTCLVRIVGSTFIPSMLRISAEIQRLEDATDESIEAALSKAKYWFTHVVAHTVAFSSDNDEAIDMLLDDEGGNRSGNTFLIAPDAPSDELLAALFQAKLNAMGAGSIYVAALTVESDTMLNLAFTITGDHLQTLPTMEEWMGEANYFDKPWWSRDDVSTLDLYTEEKNGDGPRPPWAQTFDFLIKPKIQLPSASKIVRPEFKPTVIVGGKKKDDDES